MGQRHQGFIKVKNYKYENGVKIVGSHTVGFHHQWLYGKTAVQQLRNILEFSIKASKYSSFGSEDNQMSNEEMENVICHLAGVNAKRGYYHNVISLNAEFRDEKSPWEGALNPDYQDNNDGQMFIDFTVKGKPKICFTHPFSREEDTYEEDGETTTITAFDKWQMMGAREYFHLYYSQKEIDGADNKGDIAWFKQAFADIKWIENHTKLMSQDEFFELYPNLKS